MPCTCRGSSWSSATSTRFGTSPALLCKAPRISSAPRAPPSIFVCALLNPQISSPCLSRAYIHPKLGHLNPYSPNCQPAYVSMSTPSNPHPKSSRVYSSPGIRCRRRVPLPLLLPDLHPALADLCPTLLASSPCCSVLSKNLAMHTSSHRERMYVCLPRSSR